MFYLNLYEILFLYLIKINTFAIKLDKTCVYLKNKKYNSVKITEYLTYFKKAIK